MAAKRDLTIAYGTYTIGGESTVAFPLDEINFEESYPTASFNVGFLIRASSQSALNTAELAMRAAFRQKSKNLGVTWGSRITGTDGVAVGTTTFTAATGTFASSDIGLPLNVEGRGSYQITAVGGATTITVASAITSGTGLTWRVGYKQVQVTPALRTLGGFVRATISKPGGPRDTKLSRYFRLSVMWRLPADNSGDAYRQEASISCAWSGARQATVTFQGTYTAGGGATALANYLASSPAFYTTWLGTFGITYYEKSSEVVSSVDDENESTAFSASFRQILSPGQSLAALDNSSIVSDNIQFTRTATYSHGKGPGFMAPVRGSLSYSCEVDSTITGPAALKALYTATIKPFLLSKAASLLGGTPIIESETFSFGTSSNHIQAQLQVLLAGIGNDLLSYDETVSFHLDEQWTLRKRWDKRQDTYNRHSPGHRITANRTISTTGFSKDSGVGSSVAAGPTSRDSGSASGADTSDLFGAPPASFEAAGGAWLRDSEGQNLGRHFIGYDADFQGQVRPIWTVGRQYSYIWVASDANAGHGDRSGETRAGNGGRNVVYSDIGSSGKGTTQMGPSLAGWT